MGEKIYEMVVTYTSSSIHCADDIATLAFCFNHPFYTLMVHGCLPGYEAPAFLDGLGQPKEQLDNPEEPPIHH